MHLTFLQAASFIPWLARYILEVPIDPSSIQADGSLTDAVDALDKIRHMRLLGPRDLLDSGVVPRMVQILENTQSSHRLRLNAMRCLRSLTDGGVQEIDAAIDAGIIPMSLLALKSHDGPMIQNACWAAMNIIIRGLERQLYTLLDSDLVIRIVEILALDNHQNTQNQTLSVLGLITTMALKNDKAGEVIQTGMSTWVEALSKALRTSALEVQNQAITALTALLEWIELRKDRTVLPLMREYLVPQSLRGIRDSETPSAIDKTRCHRLLALYFPEFSRRARV